MALSKQESSDRRLLAQRRSQEFVALAAQVREQLRDDDCSRAHKQEKPIPFCLGGAALRTGDEDRADAAKPRG